MNFNGSNYGAHRNSKLLQQNRFSLVNKYLQEPLILHKKSYEVYVILKTVLIRLVINNIIN